MVVANSKIIKNLLKEAGLRPKKGLGQHFLVAQGFLELISKSAGLTRKDTVLEVGPGLGVLTAVLAKEAKKVVAVEKDSAMVDMLHRTVVKEHPNVEIIQADILSLASPSWVTQLGLAKEYKVVANLPYYITSPVIRMFLEAKAQPKVMVLMVQKEVAQRICAKPPDMNLLAVSVQAYAKPEIIRIVPKNAFWPQPKVDSAIIKITPTTLTPPTTFFTIVKAGFKQPRKQLLGNLSSGLKLSRKETEELLLKNSVLPQARAETLRVEDWILLAKVISKR